MPLKQTANRWFRRPLASILSLRRLLIGPLVAFLVIALSYSGTGSSWLDYNRAAIFRGQLWRLATAHLTHWSQPHAGWCALAFVILHLSCDVRSRRLTYVVMAASAAGISLGLLLLPRVGVYRGLSGIDSALYGLLTVLLVRNHQTSRASAALILMALLAFASKLLWELYTRRAVFAGSEGGLIPLPFAHAPGTAHRIGCWNF